MNLQIVHDFFIEDCDLSTCRMIIVAINKYRDQNVVREYEFNRFNVTIFFEENSVLIEDDLFTDEEGKSKISLSDFFSMLQTKERNCSKD